jgi:hypothetical protein
VSAAEIDEYLSGIDEPKHGTLQALRRMILEIAPEAEHGISYRVPAFRVDGKVVAGFAAFKDHLSYLPFSGSVLGQLGDELRGHTMTKSSLFRPRRCGPGSRRRFSSSTICVNRSTSPALGPRPLATTQIRETPPWLACRFGRSTVGLSAFVGLPIVQRRPTRHLSYLGCWIDHDAQKKEKNPSWRRVAAPIPPAR